MGYLTLEITLISAKDIKNVNLIGKMDVYVVAVLSDDPNSKQKTPVHQDGGTKPSWNYTMRFTVDEAMALHSNSELVFTLKHDAFGPDKEIGVVRVQVSELINTSKGQKDPQFVAYQVMRSSGKAQGELNVSYKFIEDPAAADPARLKGNCSSYGQPVPAYSAPPPPGGYPHAHPPPPPPAAYPEPPPPHAYPYAPPPAAGYPGPGGAVSYQAYGHPPQGYPAAPYGGYPLQPGYGYGYPPPPAGYPGQIQQPEQQKKSRGGGFGMGLGAGLIGGAVGGLIIGDMVSDAMEDSGDGDF